MKFSSIDAIAVGMDRFGSGQVIGLGKDLCIFDKGFCGVFVAVVYQVLCDERAAGGVHSARRRDSDGGKSGDGWERDWKKSKAIDPPEFGSCTRSHISLFCRVHPPSQRKTQCFISSH